MTEIKWTREPLRPVKAFRCPCCLFKTLHGRGQDEICPVCFWHDDGQDEADAERVLAGPNRDLSLRQAQVNFRKLGASHELFLRRFVCQMKMRHSLSTISPLHMYSLYAAALGMKRIYVVTA
jgi:hypothetical protein